MRIAAGQSFYELVQARARTLVPDLEWALVDDDLWEAPRVFLTPHNAWSSPLYLRRVAELWLDAM